MRRNWRKQRCDIYRDILFSSVERLFVLDSVVLKKVLYESRIACMCYSRLLCMVV